MDFLKCDQPFQRRYLSSFAVHMAATSRCLVVVPLSEISELFGPPDISETHHEARTSYHSSRLDKYIVRRFVFCHVKPMQRGGLHADCLLPVAAIKNWRHHRLHLPKFINKTWLALRLLGTILRLSQTQLECCNPEEVR